MAKQKDRPYKPASEVPQGTKKERNGQNGLARFIEQIHTINTLYLFAGFCQVVLGLSVVVVSILGFIHPFWVSAGLSILASITAMSGIYFCYRSIPANNKKSLLRDAMRRIVEEQN